MLKSAIGTAILSVFTGVFVVAGKITEKKPDPPAEEAPAPKALADPPAGPPPARPRAKLPDFPPALRDRGFPEGPPPTDARQVLAGLIKQRVAVQEEELVASTEVLVKAIDEFNTSDYDSIDVTIEAFRQHTAKMRAIGEEVVKGYGKVAKANEQLRKELRLAPEAYKQAAAYYRERAEDYENPTLKANCLALAENCELFIPIFKERLDGLQGFNGEVDRMQPFLRETVAWLKDFEDYLKLWPGGSTAEARRSYKAKLKAYAKAFDEFQRQFERFNEKLRDATFSTKIQTEREAKVFVARSRATARKVLDLASALSAQTKVIDNQFSVAWDERKLRKAKRLEVWAASHHLKCCPLEFESNRAASLACAELPAGAEFAVITLDGHRSGIARVDYCGRLLRTEEPFCRFWPAEGNFHERDLLVFADRGGRTGGD
jgi:hypothetical protein